MSGNPDPKFSKKNQHFVPRFWMKRFADSSGQIFGRRRGYARAVQVATRSIMTADWTYTVFDSLWRPADSLEDVLSAVEGEAARLMARLDDVSTSLDAASRDKLAEVIAISGCRLPWVMRRAHRRMKEFGAALAEINQSADDRKFIDDLRERFGVELSENDCAALRSRPPEDLDATAIYLIGISPQDPLWPEQEALRGAKPIADILRKMDFALLDAPPNNLVLSDTPLPDSDLAAGFLLPLSHKLLLAVSPSAGGSGTCVRRLADPDEIKASNRFQFDSLLEIVVGPNAALLESLGT
ncbi:DUF4238 domain-containing protein [Bradyrhizobium sp. 1]|uniref:DUF4238 domain-containing protein n=1 Tax=Bradyrhizobium sp. 1 TaxID=241591 RepID=UPI001FF98C0A|nr:DUF4238 domain-containing protein [Bradyrhizobium sp. 1]MCK1395850.1 DUF4238 domain-containing protein [Bradyrhizobium sp. 1]